MAREKRLVMSHFVVPSACIRPRGRSCLAEEGLNQGSDALRNHTDHASHAGLATDFEPVRLKTIDQAFG